MDNDQPTRPTEYRFQKTEERRGRRGCSCLGRFFIGALILLALVVFTDVVITGTLVYADLSAEIEERIDALDNIQTRESFETTRIIDHNNRLL